MGPKDQDELLIRIDERVQMLLARTENLPCATHETRLALVENSVRRKAAISGGVVAGIISGAAMAIKAIFFKSH